MKIKDVAAYGDVDAYQLEKWLRSSGAHSQWVKDGFMSMTIDDKADIDLIIDDFKAVQAAKLEAYRAN